MQTTNRHISFWFDVVPLLADIVTAFVLVFAGYIAWQGLQTWRRQLEGTADFDLARRYLKVVNTLVDEVATARGPYLTMLPEVAGESEADANVRAYKASWAHVNQAIQEFNDVDSEARALWEDILDSPRQELIELLGELHLSFMAHISSEKGGPDVSPANQEIMFGGFEADSEFGKKFDKAIETHRVILRGYLKQNRGARTPTSERVDGD